MRNSRMQWLDNQAVQYSLVCHSQFVHSCRETVHQRSDFRETEGGSSVSFREE
ncbi:MAG: hypothetical protein ACPGXX_03855 [Planctomycetaceae bacterium]